MKKEITIQGPTNELAIPEINRNDVERLASLAEKVGTGSILDVGPDLKPVKAPLEKRVARSKFNSLLDEMTDEELKMTAFALCFNDRVQRAVKCYHNSVEHYTQIASLVHQLEKRGITINA